MKKKINKYQIIFLDFDGTLKLSDRIKGILFYQIFKNKINVEIKKKFYYIIMIILECLDIKKYQFI